MGNNGNQYKISEKDMEKLKQQSLEAKGKQAAAETIMKKKRFQADSVRNS